MYAQNIVADARENSSVKRVAFVRVGVLAFNLLPIEFCEVCGAECVRTDGPIYHAENRAAVNRLSMRADHIGSLPRIGACDALGGIAVCPACYTDEKTLLSIEDMPPEFAVAINVALRQTGQHAVAAWFAAALK